MGTLDARPEEGGAPVTPTRTSPPHVVPPPSGITTLARLGSRNAARNPVRSLLTAGLTASAAFLIVAVESFRRGAGPDFAAEDGGSGAFALMAETVLPLYTDPTSVKGRTALLDGVEARRKRPARCG